jgi:hypothetical protein
LHIDDYSDVEPDLQDFALRLIEGYLTDTLLVISWTQSGEPSQISTTINSGDSIPFIQEVKKGAKCRVRSWSGKKDKDFIQS